jgi:hypothetical protein
VKKIFWLFSLFCAFNINTLSAQEIKINEITGELLKLAKVYMATLVSIMAVL